MVRFIFTALIALLPLGAAAQGMVWQIPVSEDFDSYTGNAMPPGWSVSRNYDIGPLPHLDTLVHHSGTTALQLYSGSLAGSHYSIAIAPETDTPLGAGVFIRFHYYATTTAVRMEVGVCDDTGRYTRNFVPLDTIHVQQGQRWQEVVVDLASYTGTGRRVAFRLQRSMQVENSYCYVDDLRVENCGTTEPRVYNIGAREMTLDWERYGAGGVTVTYNGQQVENASAPLTLTGLQPLTEYVLSVGCSGGTQHLLTASTLAGEGLFPTYHDAAVQTLLPAEGDSSLTVLPLLESGVEIHDLNLALHLMGSEGTRLVVGVMDYALEAGTFAPIDTFPATATWTRRTLSLGTYSGTGRYLALKALGSGNLKIKELRLAHCLIDSVRLYDLSDVTVTVAWDTLLPESGSAVNVEWGPPGFAHGSGTTVAATSNPFILTGLQPSTEYDLLVTPACGDRPTEAERHRLMTFAHEVTAPYCMTFEEGGTGMPQGWVCAHGEAAVGNNSYEGLRGLHLGSQTLVTLPRVTTNDDDTLLLDFYAYGSGRLEVGFMANPYSTFHPTDTLTGGSGWRRHLVSLTIPEGQVMALRSTTAWDLDALAIHRDAVTAASVNAIAQHSAHVTWQTLHGDSVVVEYRAVASATADFADGTGTLLRGLDSLTLTGLSPDTYYALHLRPVSDGDGCLYQRCRLLTAAGAIEPPYCQNFDGLNDLPAGWRRTSQYGEYPIVSTERNRSPGKALRFSATATAHTVALLPDFATGSQHMTLAFWTNITQRPDGAQLLVGRMSDIADMASFVPTDTIVFSRSEVWELHRVELGGDHAHVALMLVGGGSGETRLFIDDLCVEPCGVENVRVANVDSASVTLTWVSYGALGVDILVRGDSYNRRDTFYTSPTLIDGLNANTPYYITVRSVCECGGGGASHNAGYGSTGIVTSDQYVSYSFNTRPYLQNLPYCLTFENYNTGSFPGVWRRYGTAASVSDRNYHTGSHSLIVGDSSYLVLPPMDQVSSLTLSIHAYASSETALTDSALTLGVTENPDSVASFTVVDTLRLSRAGEWQRLWSDLASYTGTGRYLVLRTLARGCTFFFDDLTMSTCGIGDAEVDASGRVTWQPLHAPSTVTLEYGLQGFVPGSGQQATVSESSYQLENLTSGENYDIYLTPYCSSTANCLSTKITLGTPESTPYCEHFEMAPPEGMPTGWSIGRTYGGTPAMALGSNHSLRLKGHASATNRSIAVLPTLMTDDSLQVSLSLRCAGANARLLVGHIADNADPNTFEITDTLESPTGSWQRTAAVTALPQGRRLALSCLSLNLGEAELWIDSLAVTRAVSPTVAASSARTLTLTGAPGTYIEYDSAGFQQGEGRVLCLIDGRLEIGNLTPEAEYWIYVREDSNTMTCMPPMKIHMPTEAALPYCLGDTLFSRLQLPELSIDSIRRLHLHFLLQGSVEIGIMEHSDEWTLFDVIDTIATATGTWQQVHASLASYDGDRRFVGLRALGANATVHTLTVTACPWVTAEMRDDNSVMLHGTGSVEYGTAGFTPGSGTLVTVTDSLLINTLDDTTLYDYYPLCGTDLPCQAPQQWCTSLEVPLPYCTAFGSALPLGWTPFGNAVNSQAVRISGGNLEMTVATGQTVGVKMPLMADSTVVVDMEVLLSGNGVALLLNGDSVEATPGSWQSVRLRTTHDGRMTFVASGNGNVKIRSLIVNPCALPHEVTVGQPGGGSVELNWDSTEVYGDFYVEYRLNGSSESTSVRATHPPLALHLLPDTSYILTLTCDSLGATCRNSMTVTTLANPLPIPYCTLLDTRNTMPEGWYLLTVGTTRYLVMPQFDVESLQLLNVKLAYQTEHSGQTLVLGTLSDASDPTTFDSLTLFNPETEETDLFFYSLSHYYGNGRFLALRLDGQGWVQLSHLSVSDCAVYNINMAENEAGHAILEWEQQGMPTVSVTYGPIGFADGEGTVVTATESPLRIDSLAPLTDYAFYVTSTCGDSCRTAVTDTFLTFTPKGGVGCIDYTDLHAEYVVCQYGSFNNPTEFTGAVDKGYRSALSRHTVHFDTNEYDARTGGLLRTVPEGEQASIRLGNWTVSGSGTPQAESITYGMTVDTNEFSLLLLRYAAVLQDPEHSAELQPRFRLQILNQNSELIDSCGMADFIANPSLIGSSQGWKQGPNEVLWKDWTTVGIDLTAYSGQTIFIRLITNDCGEGSHFGYAYFTLGCSSKRMRSEGCATVPSNRFTVPSGFNYRWYTNLDTTTISDSASIWVPSDNSKIYYCQLSFVDKPSCNFTMNAFAGARFPLAIIDTFVSVANCEFDLTVTNHSTISGDGITPIGTGESCETGLWILPDSSTSTANLLTLHLTDTGRVNLTLIAGIANDQCTDTLRRTIHINRLFPDATIEGRNRRCSNEPPDTLRVRSTTTFSWSSGQTGDLLLTPQGDTTVSCFTVDTNGCRDTLTHTLRVFPAYSAHLNDSICNTDTSYLWIDTLIGVNQTSGVLNRTRHLETVDQCDSVFTLALRLMPSYYIHHYDTLCHDNTLPFFDTLLATTGEYLHVDSTAFGCDSMVTMHLEIVPRVFRDDPQEVCDSLTWINGHTYYRDTRGVKDTLMTPRGCDSVVTLLLKVNHSTLEVAQDTFCQGSSYQFRSHTFTEAGFYADTLSTIMNCDSVLAIELERLDLPVISIENYYDCDSLHHHLIAHSNVPYFLWSASPYDSILDGHRSDPILDLNPDETSVIILYADYDSIPRCPATTSVTIGPEKKPEAKLRVIPQTLAYPQTDIDAYDLSDQYQERAWYVDGVLQSETSRHLQVSAPEGSDTIKIALFVDDGHCSDSIMAIIPVLYSALAAPNAFTPGAENNNTFFLSGIGILKAEIHIFNRYGGLVFSTNDFQQPWDGRNLKGEPCPSGNYVWYIRYTTVVRPNSYKEATGSVLLIR